MTGSWKLLKRNSVHIHHMVYFAAFQPILEVQSSYINIYMTRLKEVSTPQTVLFAVLLDYRKISGKKQVFFIFLGIYLKIKENTMKEKIRKIFAKLLQTNASPYAIAAGVACGVAVSFTPFVGFHLVLAMLTAFIIRANLSAAAIGTIFGNPWTFPFIWLAILYSGEVLLGVDNSSQDIHFEELFKQMFITLKNLNFHAFCEDVWPILYPMIVGSIPFYLLSWTITYIIIKRLIVKRRKK